MEFKSEETQSGCGIKVLCRFRPENNQEKATGTGSTVQYLSNATVKITDTFVQQCLQNQLSLNSPIVDIETLGQKFSFDGVFTQDDTQDVVYEQAGIEITKAILEGFNATLMAYGQTASGKTFTMIGDEGALLEEIHSPDLGVSLRVVDDILHALDAESKEPDSGLQEYSMEVAILEIYLEKVTDLLAPDNSGFEGSSTPSLKLRDGVGHGIEVDGCSKHRITCMEEFQEALTLAQRRRQTAETFMNKISSRSHEVIICFLSRTYYDAEFDDIRNVRNRLYLVDLAGSEKLEKTNAKGRRLTEARNINKSLSTLGSVISALTNLKRTHVPYRDSKLTRILQDGLGGNSKTSVILCCSPSSFNYEETISTLRFGERMKMVRNNAVVTEDVSKQELKKMLMDAKREILELRLRLGASPPETKALFDQESWVHLQRELPPDNGFNVDLKLEGNDRMDPIRESEELTSLSESPKVSLDDYKEGREVGKVAGSQETSSGKLKGIGKFLTLDKFSSFGNSTTQDFEEPSRKAKKDLLKKMETKACMTSPKDQTDLSVPAKPVISSSTVVSKVLKREHPSVLLRRGSLSSLSRESLLDLLEDVKSSLEEKESQVIQLSAQKHTLFQRLSAADAELKLIVEKKRDAEKINQEHARVLFEKQEVIKNLQAENLSIQKQLIDIRTTSDLKDKKIQELETGEVGKRDKDNQAVETAGNALRALQHNNLLFEVRNKSLEQQNRQLLDEVYEIQERESEERSKSQQIAANVTHNLIARVNELEEALEAKEEEKKALRDRFITSKGQLKLLQDQCSELAREIDELRPEKSRGSNENSSSKDSCEDRSDCEGSIAIERGVEVDKSLKDFEVVNNGVSDGPFGRIKRKLSLLRKERRSRRSKSVNQVPAENIIGNIP